MEDRIISHNEFLQAKPAPKKALLLLALLVSFPVLILLLYLTDDPLFCPRQIVMSRQSAEVIDLVSFGGLDFDSVELSRVKNTSELLESLVFSVKYVARKRPKYLYLRYGSADTFTENGITTTIDGEDISWPNFAFEDAPIFRSKFYKKVLQTSFCNFEANLPHPPVLKRFSGPLNYQPRKNAELRLEQTIAVGDEFEIEYIELSPLLTSDKIHLEYRKSAYLQLGKLDCKELRELSEKICGKAKKTKKHDVLEKFGIKISSMTKSLLTQEPLTGKIALKIKQYLEKNGTYSLKFKKNHLVHPVKQFLLTSLTGHCQHFSAAAVVLCRLQGIPARIGTGFYTSCATGTTFLVNTGMAHAWPEILTEKGWKILEISPKNFKRLTNTVAKKVKLPTNKQLAKAIEKKKREQRVEQQNKDKNDGANADEPIREQNSAWDDKAKSRKPEIPGRITKDKAREQSYLKHQEELRKQKNSIKGKINWKKIILVILLIVLCVLISLKISQIIEWLVKLLKKKEDEENETELEAIEPEILIDEIRQTPEELSGEELLEIFNKFSETLADYANFPREKNETAYEYLNRVCTEFKFPANDGELIADLLSANIYGDKKVSNSECKTFLINLQKILERVFHR